LSIYRSWIREANVQQAIRELEQLDDHSLKDIGLQRGSIEAQVRAYGNNARFLHRAQAVADRPHTPTP
jgi:uncharacterized protein YjiS (DUF1127 family)